MEIRRIRNINILRYMDMSNINEFSYLGLVYKKIIIVGEAKTSAFFYNESERHLIKIIAPDYLLISYIILRQTSENVYKQANT